MIITKALAIGGAIFCGFITSILFVAFGQITVRKLRKNPDTKDSLGINLHSGFDISMVACALTLPRSWNQRAKKRAIVFLLADTDVLYQHTTRFDRCLGRALYLMMMASTISILGVGALDHFGVFD